MECIFCKIVSGEIPAAKVYEDGEMLAFLDHNPINPGHTLLIPKEHYDNLAETPPEVAANLMRAVPDLAKAIMKAVGAPAFNLGVNNGKEAHQVVFHTHLHIMPRHEGDGYEHWKGSPYQNEEKMNEVADAIRQATQ